MPETPQPWLCPRVGCPSSLHDRWQDYYRGCRSGSARLGYRRYTKAARLGINSPLVVPALGTQRRIYALQALGWRQTDIAEAAGLGPNAIHHLLKEESIYARSRDAIISAYDALSMSLGPSETTRRIAKRRNWAPPLAYDDDRIDDPSFEPLVGPTLADLRQERAKEKEAEVVRLSRQGRSIAEIADQLRITPRTVERMRNRHRRAVAA